MSERERLINLIQQSVDGCARNWAETIAEHLLENGVIILPHKLNLPDELYRHMFDDDRQAVVVKCKVGKITEYGFTLKHPTDGREWEYKYNSIGNTVFLTKEETVERIKALKGGTE